MLAPHPAVLAPHLPLPVPLPVRFGEPSERFPKHWTVMTWVPGEPLDHGSISRGDHAADTLAGFLRALHVEAPVEAPISTDFGAHPRNCTDGFENFFQAVGLEDIAADVRAVWDDAVAAHAWEGPPVWVHGDLHPGVLQGLLQTLDLSAPVSHDLAAAAGQIPQLTDGPRRPRGPGKRHPMDPSCGP